MTVSELYDLTKWADQQIRERSLPDLYTQLHAALNRYAQPNQRGNSFESEKQHLLEAVKAADPSYLTDAQRTFLDALGIRGFLGDAGAAAIEDLLYRNVIDTVTSANRLAEIAGELTEGISKLAQISQGLHGCVPTGMAQASGEVLLRITFTGKASMKSVSEFKEWGSTWYDIGRGIAMAHQSTPDDVRIVGASTGSVVLILATTAAIAHTASFIILRGLAVAERVLDLRVKAEELRGMKLKNDKIAAELMKAADIEKSEGVDEIANEAAKTLKLTKAKNGEEIAALTQSVKDLLGFVESGGKVDFVLPAPEDDEDEKQTAELEPLRTAYKEIRQLELKLHYLEAPKDHTSEGG